MKNIYFNFRFVMWLQDPGVLIKLRTDCISNDLREKVYRIQNTIRPFPERSSPVQKHSCRTSCMPGRFSNPGNLIGLFTHNAAVPLDLRKDLHLSRTPHLFFTYSVHFQFLNLSLDWKSKICVFMCPLVFINFLSVVMKSTVL